MSGGDTDVAPVLALCAAALDLSSKGHLSRAADRWQQAVFAAQALGHPDCVVVAWCQLEAAQNELAQIAVQDAPAKEKNRLRFQRKVALTATVLPALRRRRAAGTLAPGACREWEERFRVGRAQLNTQVTVEGAAATVDQMDEFSKQCVHCNHLYFLSVMIQPGIARSDRRLARTGSGRWWATKLR